MNLDELEKSKTDNRGVFMRRSNIENIFTEKELKEEVSKLKSNGLETIFTIKEKCSRKWTVFPIFIIGLAQFAFGACLLYGGFTSVIGMSLISGALSDLNYSIFGGITGNISWKEYLIQKAIGAAVTLLTAGIVQSFNYANFSNQAFDFEFKETFSAAWRAGPGSVSQRAFNALLGKEYTTILIKTGEEVDVVPQIWRTPSTFFLRRLYQEKIKKNPEYGNIDAVRESFEDRIKEEQEYLESKYKELLKNVDLDEIAPTEFESVEEELRKEIIQNISTQVNSFIDTISDLEAVSAKPIDLDETLRELLDEFDPKIGHYTGNSQRNFKSKLDALIKNKSKISEKIVKNFFEKLNDKLKLADGIVSENLNKIFHDKIKKIVQDDPSKYAEDSQLKKLVNITSFIIKDSKGHFTLNLEADNCLKEIVEKSLSEINSRKDNLKKNNSEKFESLSTPIARSIVDDVKTDHANEVKNNCEFVNIQIFENSFTQFNNLNYLYTDHDIINISNQLMESYRNTFKLTTPLDRAIRKKILVIFFCLI